MSIPDAEKIEEEITRRQQDSRRQQEDIDSETDPAAREQKIRDKEEYDAETRGMEQVAQNLRQNPRADARGTIPRIRDTEAPAVHNLRMARDEARRLGRHDRVRQLDRQILLATKTMDGKMRCLQHLAMAPREDQFKYAMKLTLEDGQGRPIAQLAFNLFPSEALVLVDEGHPIPPVEATEGREQHAGPGVRIPRGTGVVGV